MNETEVNMLAKAVHRNGIVIGLIVAYAILTGLACISLLFVIDDTLHSYAPKSIRKACIRFSTHTLACSAIVFAYAKYLELDPLFQPTNAHVEYYKPNFVYMICLYIIWVIVFIAVCFFRGELAQPTLPAAEPLKEIP